jgi:hypothetical protein
LLVELTVWNRQVTLVELHACGNGQKLRTTPSALEPKRPGMNAAGRASVGAPQKEAQCKSI